MKAHFGASLSLRDCPFHWSTHWQHPYADQVPRRAAAEFGKPIIVNADAFPLIFGVWNSEQRQAKAWIDNLSFDMVQVLIGDPGLEIVSAGPGFLVTALLAPFDC